MGIGEVCRRGKKEEKCGGGEEGVGVSYDPGDIRPHNLQVQADVETVAFVLFLPGRVLPRRTIVGVDLR